MSSNRIEKALREATDTRYVVIEEGAIEKTGRIFADAFGDASAIVVADEITHEVAGRRVRSQLGQGEAYVFPGTPVLYADYENVGRLKDFLRTHPGTPVAVGSGTINDIVKLAAQELGRAYMAVGTAASMDGYTSYGSAVSRDGFKLNFPCAAPRAVVGDLEILAAAPAKMTAAGYADLLGKVTSGGDWIVADALGVEAIDEKAWSLVQEPLREWTAEPHRLRDGDREAFGRLMEGLNMSGLSMQYFRSSRTAAGSEHQFSHLWEMREVEHGVVSHGFKVGVGSIASAALYDRVMARDLSRIDIDRIVRDWPTPESLAHTVRDSHPNPALAESAVEHSLAKHPSPEQLRSRLELLRQVWPALRARLAKQMLTAEQLREQLRTVGCPVHPREIGKDLAELKASYFQARQIRSRYTIFDLAAESGCFSDCVEELFAPGGFWADA